MSRKPGTSTLNYLGDCSRGILDLLETFDGEWFMSATIIDWMQERHQTAERTTRRTLARLKERGLIESRRIEINGTWPKDNYNRTIKQPSIQVRTQYRVPSRQHLDDLYR